MLLSNEPKNWQQQATEYAFKLVREFVDKYENIEKYQTNGYFEPGKCAGDGFTLHETGNRQFEYNRKYFYLKVYATDKHFVIGWGTEKIYCDTKFDDAPISAFLPEPGQKKLTNEDKEIIKEKLFNAITRMTGFNEALRKSIDMIEEKYLIEREFE